MPHAQASASIYMKTVDQLNDIKLFATDLDGTLLNDEGEVSEENRRALKYLMDHGVHVVTSSGRILPFAHKAAKKIELDVEKGINIGAGGGIVYEGEKLLKKINPMDNDAYRRAVKAAKEMGFDVIVTDGDSVFYDDHNGFVEEYETINLPDYPEKIVKVDNLEDLEDVIKIMFHYHSPEEFEAAKTIEQDGVEVFSGGPDLVEVSSPKLSKWAGLQEIMKLEDLKPENVLTVGDSGNDGPMLKYSGIGVAMKNALPEVMDQCDLVNDFDNNEDGVAEIIWTLFAPELSTRGNHSF